jgi:hypothetical protein
MPFALLRWAVALVLGTGATALVVSCLRAERPVALLALGVCELLAAALFVVPRTLRAGGLALLAALAAATAVHAWAGQPPPPSFAVYAAAIWAVMAEHRRAAAVSA